MDLPYPADISMSEYRGNPNLLYHEGPRNPDVNYLHSLRYQSNLVWGFCIAPAIHPVAAYSPLSPASYSDVGLSNPAGTDDSGLGSRIVYDLEMEI